MRDSSPPLLSLLILILLGCRPGGDAATTPADAGRAPLSERAAIHIEPPVLTIGDVAEIEIRVVAAPESRLLPTLPPPVPGVWILDSRPLETIRDDGRWIHRRLVRVRARDLGEYLWPESEVVIEDALGETRRLSVPERSFAVVSTVEGSSLPRPTPFGLRAAPRTEKGRLLGDGRFWRGVLVGLASASLAVGLLYFVGFRRLRGRAKSPLAESAEPAPADALRDWAERELATAEAALRAEDPRRALNSLAHLMRAYLTRRFDLALESQTTEELGQKQPPLRLASRWPELLRISRALDDARFQPGVDLDLASARAEQILRELRELIAAASPGLQPRAEGRDRAEPEERD